MMQLRNSNNGANSRRSLRDVTNSSRNVLQPINKNINGCKSPVTKPSQQNKINVAARNLLIPIEKPVASNPFAAVLEPRPQKPKLGPSVVDTVVLDIDKNDSEDPLWAAEYVQDIYQFLRAKEHATFAPRDYLVDNPQINAQMRAILIDWLILIHIHYKYGQETLYLTVHLIDRFMAKNSVVVSRNKFQLVGAACFLIAAKYEEIYAPRVDDLANMTANNYSVEEIVDAETFILQALEYKITVPTANVFLKRYLKAGEADKHATYVGEYFLEGTLLSYKLLQFPPSLLAAAAVMIARDHSKSKNLWTPTLVEYTHYTEEKVRPVAQTILAEKAKIPFNVCQVSKKYSAYRHGEVAAKFFSSL